MPHHTGFQDHRAYNILYQYRRDTFLLDRLVDNMAQGRRLLQFVPGEPGLPGQYRIDPTARTTLVDEIVSHTAPAGTPPTDNSPSSLPRTPPEDAIRAYHHWTGPSPRSFQQMSAHTTNNNHRHTARDRSRSRDHHND